jgi:hypothetical protein
MTTGNFAQYFHLCYVHDILKFPSVQELVDAKLLVTLEIISSPAHKILLRPSGDCRQNVPNFIDTNTASLDELIYHKQNTSKDLLIEAAIDLTLRVSTPDYLPGNVAATGWQFDHSDQYALWNTQVVNACICKTVLKTQNPDK